METKLKFGVEGDLRSLAVEIVDALKGYSVEFSNQPGVHLHDYDIVERILIKRIGARVKGRTREPHEMTEEERVRFDELVGWAEVRAINAKDGIDLDKLAERLFDFLCDDPDDLFPEISSPYDYGYEVQ